MTLMDRFLHTIGALNDETRIKILRFVQHNTKVCVCDIEGSFGMIQSRVSRHLKILKDGGFLQVERQGRWAYYSVCTPLYTFRLAILDEIASLDLDIPPLKKGCQIE